MLPHRHGLDKLLAMSLIALLPAVAVAGDHPDKPGDAIEYIHNGSMMLVSERLGVILYLMPKATIARAVRPGDILFRGAWRAENGRTLIEGTAFTFKLGCTPAPYPVSGEIRPDGETIALTGASPMRDKLGCAVIGYSWSSPNATLLFTRRAADAVRPMPKPPRQPGFSGSSPRTP